MSKMTGKAAKSVFYDGATLHSNQVRHNIQGLPVSQRLKRVLEAAVVTNMGPENKSNAISMMSQKAAERKLGGAAADDRYPNPYWFEFGTQPRRSGGGDRGQITPTPFFRMAIQQVRNSVKDVLVTGLGKIVESAGKK